MPDIFLRQGDATPSNILLRDPTQPDGGGTAYTLTALYGAFTLTGENAEFDVTLPCSNGSFSLSGQNATFIGGSTESFGSFVLSGQNATLAVSMTTAAGAFVESGQNATPDVGLPAAFGSFTESGQAVSLDVTMGAAFGAFSMTGENADLSYTPAGGINYTLTANYGAFSLNGQNAVLGVSQTLAVGSFSLSGQNATPEVSTLAGVGTFSLSGQLASLNLVAFVPVIPIVPPPIVPPVVPPIVVIPPSTLKIATVVPRSQKPQPVQTGVPGLSMQIPWWDRKKREVQGSAGTFLLWGGVSSYQVVRAPEPAAIPTEDYELLCSGGSFVSGFGQARQSTRRKRISSGGKVKLWTIRGRMLYRPVPPREDEPDQFDMEQDDEEAIVMLAGKMKW